MPIKYIVGDRKARPFARWSLRLPSPQVVLPPPPPRLSPQVLSSRIKEKIADGRVLEPQPPPLQLPPLPPYKPPSAETPLPAQLHRRPPLLLPRGAYSLAEAKMGEIVVGRLRVGNPGYQYTWRNREFSWSEKRSPDELDKLQLGKSGIWTGGISDCMVVCAAYYSGGAWKQFWFQHVAGGLDSDIMKSIEEGLADCGETNQRYAVVAARYESGTAPVSEDLMRVGLPAENVKIYVTSSAGFAFGINFVDDVFGEVTWRGDQLPDDPDKFW